MRLSDHERAQGGTVTLSAEQFDKLVELLTPGYELALAYKAQMTQAPTEAPLAAPPDHEPPVPEPAAPTTEPLS